MNKIVDTFCFFYTISYIIAVVLTAPDLIPILKRNSSNSVRKGNEIIDSKLIICDENNQNCHAIEKFSVAENNSLNCFQNDLEIRFFLEKIEVSGFLSDGLSHILNHKLEKSNFCKKLKRFFSVFYRFKVFFTNMIFYFKILYKSNQRAYLD
jgi:hypothetical protein